MNFPRHRKPKPQWIDIILSSIRDLLKMQSSIMVHRSKLYSLFDDYRVLEKTFDPDPNLPPDTIRSLCSLFIDCLNRTKQIVYYSSAAHWSQPAIQWPSGTTRDSIRRIREDTRDCLVGFGCKTVPNFIIDEDKLKAQNDVDMLQMKGSLLDYLGSVQNQPQTPQIHNVIQLINERLRSIGPIEGLHEGPALMCVPPFLPARLNLVLSHDQFEIGNVIGTGTFGSVHVGYMGRRKVAIKILNNQVLGGRQLETFKREVWTMATLNHPSLLKLLGVTLTPPFCIITELLKCSLYDRLKYLTPTKRSIIALKISQGMEQLHNARIIHRDLKSANILLDDEDMPRICDFGLVGFKTGSTRTGYVGTAQWMAPEILRSSPFYDEKVDVYSFGVLLWEMLTLQEPYAGMSQDQMVMAVIEKLARPAIPPHFGPPRLVELIHRCWAEQPSHRPSFPQISAALMQPDFHFMGTQEAEFVASNPHALLSLNLVHAFDCGNMSRVNELLGEVSKEAAEADPQLIPVVMTLFSGLSVDQQVYFVRLLPSMVDFDAFVAKKGYSFVTALFSGADPVVTAAVEALREIDLSAKPFRQVRLIAALARSSNPDALTLLAELCEYPDIAEQVASHELPLPAGEARIRESLLLYRNLFLHPHLGQRTSEHAQPIVLAARALPEMPHEACAAIEFFLFSSAHERLIVELDLVRLLARASSVSITAIRIIARIIPALSAEALAPIRPVIEQVVKRHRPFFRNVEDSITRTAGIPLSKIEWEDGTK